MRHGSTAPSRQARGDADPVGDGARPHEPARTLGLFFALGSGVALSSIAVGAWPGTDHVTILAVGLAALLIGCTLWSLGRRTPAPVLSVALALGTLLIATVQLASGSPAAAATYGIFYIFCVTFAVLFTRTAEAVTQTALVVVVQILVVGELGSFAPGDRRGITAQVLINVLTSVGVAVVMAHHLRRRRRAEWHVRTQSQTDALTGLANRVALLNRLDTVTAEASEASALLLLDVSDFRDVNDTFGAEVGDQLLKVVARRLRAAVRDADVVARTGGDEFAVLLTAPPGSHVRHVAQRTATRLLDAAHEPFDIEGIALSIEVRVGVALTAAGASAEDVLRQADLAADRARHDTRSVATVAHVPPRRSPDRLALLADVRRSLEPDADEASGALIPYFQPVVAVAGGHIVGAEALARWMHPTRGLVAPGAFLPLVERTSLMREVTAHMLAGALQACATWYRGGTPLSVSVNISARDLNDPALVDTVAAEIERAGVPASALIVEITETAMVSDPAHASGVIEQLRSLGTGVSVDDFGTGWSSLAQLQRLPVTELKVDQSFVVAARADEGAAKIVAATIGLAQSLGLSVVAEGVEDRDTLSWLRELGCDLAQGWLFGRPMPAADFAALTADVAAAREATGHAHADTTAELSRVPLRVARD